jgi:EAL domain-containing protein (putative c-di-GMP-specific phosphodiesterase class I)/CHASE2 domain-containing sensor protein
MKSLTHLAGVILVIAGAFGAHWVGVLTSGDRALEDLRFSITSRPPSGETVLVEIDATSLAQMGVWPWPRSIHAEVLDRLMEMGAREVAFDVDFSSTSNRADDAAFAAALERAGGYAYLAAFVQATQTGMVLSTPIAAFAEFAQPVLVNVHADAGGVVTAATAAVAYSGGVIPSLALALAGTMPDGRARHDIDFSIDLEAIDRVSVIDVLEGTVDPERISNKQVIVGASALELRDLFRVPRFGVVPGPLIQIGALETLKAGRTLTPLGIWPALILALVAGTFSRYLRTRSQLAGSVVLALTMAAGAEIIALALLEAFGLVFPTMAVHVTLLGLIALRVINQLTLEHDQRRAAQQRLEHLARFDPVTEVLSRQGLMQMLERGSAEGSGGLILARLTGLETVWASLGHQVVEQTMRQAAVRLHELNLGTVARVADQTFAVTIDGSQSEESLNEAAALMRRALADNYVLGDHRVFADVELATAARPPVMDVRNLLPSAEMAMISRPVAAAAATATFTDDLIAKTDHRRRLDIDLRHALARGQLTIAFQPQIGLRNGRFAGAEALLRWRHPEFGMISPVEFIPLAERTGYINDLGHWVLLESCRTAAANPWLGKVAVNVSGTQFQMSDMARTVRDVLEACSLPPERLEIEVTEGTMVERGEITGPLTALRELGVSVAIDDFGTGFSSLSYLAELPFDKLKIDKSFVTALSGHEANHRIIKAIIEMGLALDKTVLAEGIETKAEAVTLTALGCHFGQGYWYSKPKALAKLEAEYRKDVAVKATA